MGRSRHRRGCLLISAVLLAAVAPAQNRIHPLPRWGDAAVGLLLRQIANNFTVMICTAHPDDENSALIARLALGEGARVVVVTATRGNGGQNEIGPELGEALAVLRTEELLAVHRLDGAEQAFCRAVDFGYSFSVDETLRRWSEGEILGDFVRAIRAYRPDVVITMHPIGDGGGQHHQASARLAARACELAGQASAFPEQLRDGMMAWTPRRVVASTNFGLGAESQPSESRPSESAPAESRPGRGRRGESRGTDSRAAESWPTAGQKTFAVETSVFDPLLGCTYAELGMEARSMHKCQGMAQLLALPSRSVARFRDVRPSGESGLDEPRHPRISLFDGLDPSFAAMAERAGDPPEVPRLRTQLAEMDRRIMRANYALQTGARAALEAELLALSAELYNLAGWPNPLFRGSDLYDSMSRKAGLAGRAVEALRGIRVEALAEDGLVTLGQTVMVKLHIVQQGPSPIGLEGISLMDGGNSPGSTESRPSVKLIPGVPWSCSMALHVQREPGLETVYWRKVPGVDRYDFGRGSPDGPPFTPTSFRAWLQLKIAGASFFCNCPVEFRYPGNVFSGEKRHELIIVPEFSVRTTPEFAIVPLGLGGERAARDVQVTVVNCTPGAASGAVTLELPEGWSSDPVQVPLAFAREDEAMSVTFSVRAPPTAAGGRHDVRAVFTSAPMSETRPSARFDRGFQVIEYPHITRRHLEHEAKTTFEVLDLKIVPGLQVGYVMGVGDEVPAALEQLGAKVTLLQEADLAGGDLDRFDAIMTGVRAYERRSDLRSFNRRLLDYAARGGVVIVQYNKMEFNDAQYGPWPAKVSTNRVTDETAPVEILAPEHPVFRTPNVIGPETWADWVQERGQYFLGERDPRYVDLVQSQDPFPYNQGIKKGALVEGRVGQGRWVYVGLNLWRQLPAGTPGAYRLMANLIGLKRAAGP